MILNVLLAVGIGWALGSQPPALPSECAPGVTDVEYEIVVDWREFFGSSDTGQRYDINVSRWLTQDEVEDVICCLTRKLRIPEEWDAVSLNLYRDLDLGLFVRNMYAASPEDRTAFWKRVIAKYSWNSYYSEKGLGGTMTIHLDGSGQAVNLENKWDYAKSCEGWRAKR